MKENWFGIVLLLLMGLVFYENLIISHKIAVIYQAAVQSQEFINRFLEFGCNQ